MTDYDRKAALLPASNRRVYQFWLKDGQNKSKKQAYELALLAFDDNAEYQRMKKEAK